MLSLKKINPEYVLALVVILLLVLLFLKTTPVEGAKGFYVVRPTYWKATPDKLGIEFTSFYPTSLICQISVLDQNKTVKLDPRTPLYLEFNANFRPGSYVNIRVDIDCNEIKEKGTINTFVFTT